MKYYIVLFFDRDMIKHSELIGLYTDLDKAVEVLIQIAGYQTDENNNLTQYKQSCDDYASMGHLIEYVKKNRYLIDHDKYVISEYDLF